MAVARLELLIFFVGFFERGLLFVFVFLQRVLGAVESVERLTNHFLNGFPALADGFIFAFTTRNQ